MRVFIFDDSVFGIVACFCLMHFRWPIVKNMGNK